MVPKPAVEDYSPRIARGEVWLLEEHDEVSGLIVLQEGPDYVLVYSIAVRPAQQGRGHATKLLQFAEQQAFARGVHELRLYTNIKMERNIALYRRCGFVEIGTRPHPSRSGEALVDMVKQVLPRPASF
jgi:ribosomal protein S18 acetylase RimI-like enzyme